VDELLKRLKEEGTGLRFRKNALKGDKDAIRGGRPRKNSGKTYSMQAARPSCCFPFSTYVSGHVRPAFCESPAKNFGPRPNF